MVWRSQKLAFFGALLTAMAGCGAAPSQQDEGADVPIVPQLDPELMLQECVEASGFAYDPTDLPDQSGEFRAAYDRCVETVRREVEPDDPYGEVPQERLREIGGQYVQVIRDCLTERGIRFEMVADAGGVEWVFEYKGGGPPPEFIECAEEADRVQVSLLEAELGR